jgi:hypothetical protein
LVATAYGYQEFIEKETDAVHKDTFEIYDDAILKLKDNPQSSTFYIHKELEKYGIFITPKFIGRNHIEIKPIKNDLGFFEKWAYKIIKKKINKDLADLSWILGVEDIDDPKLSDAYEKAGKLNEMFIEYFKI